MTYPVKATSFVNWIFIVIQDNERKFSAQTKSLVT